MELRSSKVNVAVIPIVASRFQGWRIQMKSVKLLLGAAFACAIGLSGGTLPRQTLPRIPCPRAMAQLELWNGTITSERCP